MRRLAKHSRDDQYATRRDYQTITEHQSLVIKITEANTRIVLQTTLIPDEASFFGFGGYIKPSISCVLKVSILTSDELIKESLFSLSENWNRVGLAANYDGEEEITVILEFHGKVESVELWGVDCDLLSLPDTLIENNVSLENLESTHLCPETLYLPHQQVLNMDVNTDLSSPLVIGEDTGTIELKKCSYCGRQLPLDSQRPGALAFHKHNAKISGHQNECRSCKKWRINNAFNPRRTVDQLHESSVITRERKLLLREPEILQNIKDRRGAGLKSIVWRKFDKRCFRCGKPLKLEEVQLDHTRPLAYLYPIDEYATCLCDVCNNFKKDRFPRDVYNEGQLKRLADITGLSYDELTKKDVNEGALREILADVSKFAKTWTARMMNSTARKIKELRPDVDLFDVLRQQDPDTYERVMSELSVRPGEDDE